MRRGHFILSFFILISLPSLYGNEALPGRPAGVSGNLPEVKEFPLWIIHALLVLFLLLIVLILYFRIHRKRLELEKQALARKAEELETELEIMSRQLENTSEKLIHSEEQSLVSRLVTGIAHEVNTPMGVVLTSLTYNKELLSDIEKLYAVNDLGAVDFDKFLKSSGESLDICLMNVHRAIELIRNFKNISAEQIRDDMCVVNLKDHTENLILALYPELKKTRIKVHTNLADRIVQTYPGALNHIIVNLILNSLNHGFDPGEEGDIYISFLKKGGDCRILYSDNGKGILRENIHKIFDPFYTTGREKGNTGLGLSILKNVLTEKLNGRVQARTEPGRYTCFDITFPVHRIS